MIPGWDGPIPWDGKIAKQHKLVRVVRRQKKVLERARHPLRGSRYANHLYTDHQHVVLLALRKHFGMSYRDFCGMIEVCTEILDELGLRRVPHWTTLHKFSKRADTRRVEHLLLGVPAGGASEGALSGRGLDGVQLHVRERPLHTCARVTRGPAWRA